MGHPGRQAGSGASPGNDAGRRPLRLCLASDLHIKADPAGELGGANVRDNADRVFAHLEGLAASGALDLLLLNGDISHDGSDDSYSYVTARLASIPVPCLVVPGNHDTGGPFSADFASLPKTVRLGQSWDLHLLDSRVPGQEHGQLTSSTCDFLVHALAGPATTHLVALHHDVLQVGHSRRPGIPHEDVTQLLSAVVAGGASRIVIICSHRHQFTQATLGCLLFVTTGAVSCQFDFTQVRPVVTSRDPEFVIMELDDRLDLDDMCHRIVL